MQRWLSLATLIFGSLVQWTLALPVPTAGVAWTPSGYLLGGPTPPKPFCIGPCSHVNSVAKQDIVWDGSCAPFPWQAPRRIVNWSCLRYQCVNGFNWKPGNDRTWGSCTDQALEAGSCPDSSCNDPIP